MPLCFAALAVSAGVVLQRITGIGFASVAAPVLVLLWGPVTGVQAVNLLAALTSLLLLLRLWRRVDLPQTALLTAAAVVTTPLGVLLVLTLPAAALQVLLGATMLAALFAVRAASRWRLVRGRWGAPATGALAGVANATVGQAGPLTGAFALASRWELTSYVASMQLCWMLVNSAAVALKGMPPLDPRAMVVLVGSVVVGYLVSLVVTRFVSPTLAARALFGVVLVGALVVLGKGLLDLIG